MKPKNKIKKVVKKVVVNKTKVAAKKPVILKDVPSENKKRISVQATPRPINVSEAKKAMGMLARGMRGAKK